MTALIRFLSTLLCQNMTPNALKSTSLLALKVFKICLKMFAPITKVNEGESKSPCPSPSSLEVTYSSG
jgi:hypothetical protein